MGKGQAYIHLPEVLAPPVTDTEYREAIIQRFNILPIQQMARKFNPAFIQQLRMCADDSARRLLIGISEKEESVE